MKLKIAQSLVIFSLIFSTSVFAEEAPKEGASKEEVKPENNSKEDPSKTGKKTLNSIFSIPLKSKEPRRNKLLDAGNELFKGKKSSPPPTETDKEAAKKPE